MHFAGQKKKSIGLTQAVFIMLGKTEKRFRKKHILPTWGHWSDDQIELAKDEIKSIFCLHEKNFLKSVLMNETSPLHSKVLVVKKIFDF